MCVCVCVCINRERERERQAEASLLLEEGGQQGSQVSACACACGEGHRFSDILIIFRAVLVKKKNSVSILCLYRPLLHPSPLLRRPARNASSSAPPDALSPSADGFPAPGPGPEDVQTQAEDKNIIIKSPGPHKPRKH